MVSTAILSTRRELSAVKVLDIGSLIVGVVVTAAAITFGVQATHTAKGLLDGYPASLYFTFAAIGLIAIAGDPRLIIRDGIRGKSRIVRHLWRMCFAMFVANGSFFLGQAKLLPRQFRIFPLLAIPGVIPILFLFYWLVRVRFIGWYDP